MRTHGLALAGALLLSAAAGAQQQPQQPPQQPPAAQPAPALDPARDPLDALLVRWEQQMKSIDGLAVQCTRTTVSKVFQDTDVFAGTAKYMKPNLAVLELQHKKKPDRYEKFICSGTYIYEFVPAEKKIRAHQLPPPKPGQVADDNFLSFLFGMKAEEAKRRYDLKLTREDQYYLYIDVLPRFPADKADFKVARLVLNKDSYLPRQLWFMQPNQDEVTWDLLRLDTKATLDRKEFEAPAVPKDWKLEPVPRKDDPQPRVIRQNQ